MGTLVKAEKLYFRYDDHQDWVLKDINIEIKKGELVAIIGHNASGKSTFAKLINALLLPAKGRMEVLGMDTADMSKLWDIRQKIGMVFQNPDNQLVATVVEEDVAFGPENQGIDPKEIRERVDDALKTVGLFDYRKHGPHLLSGGQKQRVAIAGVLAMKPECIVLDEATAMLDPQGRREIMGVIKRLNKEQQKTIIHITHYMEEAAEADRILVMDSGSIIMSGTPAEVFSQFDRLKALGLDVPQLTELARRLIKNGFNMPPVFSEDGMVIELCRLR